MNSFKHYSFDLWFTLIKSNPIFKKERAQFFYKNYNFSNKSLFDIEAAFRTVDLMCNSINQKTGNNIAAEEMYLMVIYLINENDHSFNDIDLVILYDKMEALLLKHSPTVFCKNTKNVLDAIKQKKDVTTNILSNTAFIKGSSLKKIIQYLDIAIFFDFQIFSDEVNLSKPNKKIYNLLVEEVSNLRKLNQIELHQIIHIGDNPIADIQGAVSRGIMAYQINSNNNLISNLIN